MQYRFLSYFKRRSMETNSSVNDVSQQLRVLFRSLSRHSRADPRLRLRRTAATPQDDYTSSAIKQEPAIQDTSAKLSPEKEIQDSASQRHTCYTKLDATIINKINASMLQAFASEQQIDVGSSDALCNKLKGVTEEKTRLNYQNALEFLLQTQPLTLNLDYIRGLHCIVASGTTFAGDLRARTSASSCKLLFLAPDEHSPVSEVMKALLQELNAQLMNTEQNIYDLAAWLGYTIVHIRPFDDCNSRLARLLIQWILHLRGLPFCISLCSPYTQQAYISAMRHSDSSQLAALITRQVSDTWKQYLGLCSSALHQYYQTPTMSPQEICKIVINEDVNKKQTACCSVCTREGASVVLRCCESSIHMSCLMEAYDKRAMSLNCPECHGIIEAFNTSDEKRISRKHYRSMEREKKHQSRKKQQKRLDITLL